MSDCLIINYYRSFITPWKAAWTHTHTQVRQHTVQIVQNVKASHYRRAHVEDTSYRSVQCRRHGYANKLITLLSVAVSYPHLTQWPQPHLTSIWNSAVVSTPYNLLSFSFSYAHTMRLWFARDIWRYRNVFWLIDWLIGQYNSMLAERISILVQAHSMTDKKTAMFPKKLWNLKIQNC